MPFAYEDKVLIKHYRQHYKWGATWIKTKFPDKKVYKGVKIRDFDHLRELLGKNSRRKKLMQLINFGFVQGK